MVIGRQKTKLSADERDRLEVAVESAERISGLQFLVYLGSPKGDPHRAAEQMLVALGYASVPGVVLLVAPRKRHVEVVTSPAGRERVSDEACQRSVDIMLPAFRQRDWIAGLELGLASLAEEAGPGEEHPDDELPNLLE